MTPIRHDESDRPINHPPESDAVLVGRFRNTDSNGDVHVAAIRYQRGHHGGSGYYPASGDSLGSRWHLDAYRPATPEETAAYEAEAEQ